MGPKPSEWWCASHLHSEGCPGTASAYKRRGVRALWDRRAVRKAGGRFCTQAILRSSNASPDDLSGAEPQPWCLNSLRGGRICNSFLFQSCLKSHQPQDNFPVVPSLREQVCEIFALAILQLKDKIPVLYKSTCLEVTPGKLPGLFLSFLRGQELLFCLIL